MYKIDYHLNGKSHSRNFTSEQHIDALFYLRRLHTVLSDHGPVTHKQTADTLDIYYGNVAVVNVVRFHNVQFESFRVEA